MNNVSVKILIAAIILAMSCMVSAQSVVALRLDTLNFGGEELGFSTTYVLDVPDTPGLLIVYGNNYGQPDRFTLRNERDSVLYISPYVGRDFCDCTNCVLGPVAITDGSLESISTVPDCFHEFGLSSDDEYGAWSLVWNTTGIDILSLTMRMWQDGSSWQLYPIWIPLPSISYDCDGIIVQSMTDTDHYLGDSVVHTVHSDCMSYDWQLVRPSNISPCKTTEVYLPNAFAPESGGDNARWRPWWPADTSEDQHRWYIYNRQGALVASGYGGDSWDGTVSDQSADTGVYTCIVVSVSGQVIANGDITLLR
jgi:hypothetical protein